jgi:Xaa-Pro aminopeptidase
VKDERELQLLRKASDATARGHRSAMRAARPGLYEYQSRPSWSASSCAPVVRSVGYSSIVAAGRNGAVLHYTSNDARSNAGSCC